MIFMVKMVEQMNASTVDEMIGMRTSPNKKRDRLILLSVGWVPFLELLQDADLYLARVAVLWYSPDDLHCHSFIRHGVNGLHDFSKCPLTKKPDSAICE